MRKVQLFQVFIKLALSLFVGCGFFRIYMSYEVTKAGYAIGTLKQSEIHLLENKSKMEVRLEKLMTRDHLKLMASENSFKGTKRYTKLAQN